jgi:predicted nucleic acid-binding protein
MSGDFLDSNVIVYIFDDTNRGKQNAAAELIDRAQRDATGWISYQVVQEVLNTFTHKFARPGGPMDARSLLGEVLMPLLRVMPSRKLYDDALSLHARYQYSFYDSLIIAAALASGCTRLYSEDLQTGQRIDGLTIVDPFRS